MSLSSKWQFEVSLVNSLKFVFFKEKMTFTNSGKCDIMGCYIVNQNSGYRAHEHYSTLFPMRNLSDRRDFLLWYRKCRLNENVLRKPELRNNI